MRVVRSCRHKEVRTGIAAAAVDAPADLGAPCAESAAEGLSLSLFTWDNLRQQQQHLTGLQCKEHFSILIEMSEQLPREDRS